MPFVAIEGHKLTQRSLEAATSSLKRPFMEFRSHSRSFEAVQGHDFNLIPFEVIDAILKLNLRSFNNLNLMPFEAAISI